MRNRKAFTLIEILAVIVVLAIIALIAIPNINGYIKRSQEGRFEASINSLINAYRYQQIDDGDDLGRVPTCSLDVEKCNTTGYVEKCDNKICVYITDGKYCAIGSESDYVIMDGNCNNTDPDDPIVPPVINNIAITNLTVSSADVLVTFTEKHFVVSHKYRLLDRNGQVVVDWTSGDSINNLNVQKSSLKKFTGLEKGEQYTVEVEIVNNNESNNTVRASKTFTTLSFNAATITYDTTKWETQKEVTITYPTLSGIERKYILKTNTGWNDSGTQPADVTQLLIVKNYQYIVEAIVSSGSSNITSSSVIGFIDNELDENNTKPTSQALNYRNSNGINTNLVSLRLQDTKSGIAYYCVTTSNNANNCSGTGNNTQLNKWVLAVTNASDLAKANKEVRDRTVQHQFADGGKYYVFVKDAVGNISDSKEINLYKVEYDLNGGTGTVNYQIKLHGNDVVLSDVTPTRSGYVFLGWDTNKDAHTDTPTYTKKGTYKTNANVKLYAQWRKTVTITYNGNGGTGSVSSNTCYRYNAEATCPITFRTNGFTRTGYTYKGWAKGQNNVAVSYNPNTSYNIAESETVYAAWQANALTFNNQSFTKTFDTNSQTMSITGATNGNGSYTYEKVSEKKGTDTTNYVTINASTGAITIAGSTPVGTYTVQEKVKSTVSNTFDGTTEVSKTVTMTITVNTYNVSNATIATVADVVYKHAAYTPEPVVTVKTSTNATSTTLVKGTDFTYSYTNNTNVGTATITITGKGNYTGTKSITFKINAYNVSNVDIASVAAVTYKGAAYTPEPVITAFKGLTNQEVMVKGTDFTYSYTNNKNAGTATITITGKGNYTGTKSTTFIINKKSVATTWSNTSLTYNNANQKPTASVSTGISGETMTVTVSGEKKAAETYTATVACTSVTNSSCDNYTVTNTSTSFTINPYNVSNVTIADVAAVTFKNGAYTPEPAVTASAINQTLVKGTDFDYSYTNNTNAGTATITVTGKGNFTGTKTKTFTINAYNMSNVSIADVAAVTYKNAAYTPEPAVTDTSINKTLVKGTDFTYSYSNNTNAGTATITVTGKGNFTGTNTKTFTINKYNVSNATIADVTAVTYKGAAYTPEPAVTASAINQTLVKGTDFTYSYADNTNVGTATITITGTGNFTGTKTKTFAINKKSLAVSWSNTSLTYNNANQKPTASVNTGISGKTLTINTDNAKKDVGTYTSNATCANNTDSCSNYSFTNTSSSYTISAYNVSNVTIDSVGDKVYNGTPYTPEPTVTATAITQTLVKGTDFTYSYKNNQNKGTATITVTGKGNFTGTKTQTFKITPANTVTTLTCATLTYNGATQGLMSVTSTTNQNLYYSMTTQLTASNYSSSGTSIAADSPKAINAGNYTIYWYAPEDNYKAYSGSTTCTISKKALTVTAKAQTVTYGTAITTGTGQITTGSNQLVSGHSVTAVTLTPSTSNVVSNGTITPSAVTVKKNNDDVTSNYNITYTNGKLVINKKDVTITAKAQTVTYGTAISKTTSDVTASGLVSGHSVTAITLAQSTTNVTTTGKITASAATIKSGSTDVTSNYNISYAQGTLTINKKAVTITAKAQTVNYGTAISKTTSDITASGLLSGHSVTAITLAQSTTNYTTNGTITPSAATIKTGSTDVTSNYNISYATGTLKINKVDATCPTLTAYSAAYDGSAHTIGVSGGSGGTIQYRTSTTASWSNTNPSYTNVTSAVTVYVQVAGDGNHNTKDCGSKTLTISKRNATITAKAQTVNYGTAISKTTSDITTSGLVSGHSVTAITLAQSTTNYTTNGTITPSAATIKTGSTDVTSNYNISYATGTLKINKVDATCPTLTAYSAAYDGAAHSITVSGGSGGTIQYRTSTSASWSNTKPSATTVSSATVYVQVAGDGNHNTKDCGSKGLTISKRNATITAKAQTVNYGTAISKTTSDITTSGLVSGHSVTAITLAQSTTNYTTNGTITPSAATIKTGSTDVTSNYNISYATGVLKINKVDATCPTLTAYSAVYDGSAHSITVSGGSGGTIQYRTSTSASWSNTKPSATNVSTTTVYVQVAGDGNHNTKDCGSKTITISNATLSGSVKITGTNKVNQTLTASVTNTNSASLAYQWYRGSSAISGATSSTYKVVAADAGNTIKVIVTATKANYSSASWNDTTDATNNGSATAQAAAYTVVFNANGGSGSMSNQTINYDTATALTANAYSKSGNVFMGWSTSATTPTSVSSLTGAWSSGGSTTYSGGYYNFTNMGVNAPFAEGDVYLLTLKANGSGSLYTYFYGESGYMAVAKSVDSNGQVKTNAVDGSNPFPLPSSQTQLSVIYRLAPSGSYSGTNVRKYMLTRVFDGNSGVVSNPAVYKMGSGVTQIYGNKESVTNLTSAGGSITLYAMWAPNFTCSQGTPTVHPTYGNICVMSAYSSTSGGGCSSWSESGGATSTESCGCIIPSTTTTTASDQSWKTVCTYSDTGRTCTRTDCGAGSGTYSGNTRPIYRESCINYTCSNYYSGSTSYYCPSGWNTYSGSGSSLTCYKAA